MTNQSNTDKLKLALNWVERLRKWLRNPIGLLGSVPSAAWVGDALSQVPGLPEIKWWMTAALMLLLHIGIIGLEVLAALLKRVDNTAKEVSSVVEQVTGILIRMEAGHIVHQELKDENRKHLAKFAEIEAWREAAERDHLLLEAKVLGISKIKKDITLAELRMLVAKRRVSHNRLKPLQEKTDAVRAPDMREFTDKAPPPLEPQD